MAYTTETLDNGAVVISPRAVGQIWKPHTIQIFPNNQTTRYIIQRNYTVIRILSGGQATALDGATALDDFGKKFFINRTEFERGSLTFVGWAPKYAVAPVTIDLARFPQKCPRCGDPAYVGFNAIDCSRSGCR